MKKVICVLIVSLFVAGCAASVASKYGIKEDIDKFNNNQKRVTMTGGVIDADYMGMVANAAEFNPFVVRSKENKIIATGIFFNFENNVTITKGKWLNLIEGSKAIFLLNNGANKIELTAVKGDMDFSVTAPQRTVYTTHFDRGVFLITPDQLKQIANSSSIEVRVLGATSHIDFPRKPNNHIVENFLPNIKKFYETEVQPYL
jgi:hypothetical protein